MQRASRSGGPAGPPPAGGSGKTPGHIEVAAEVLGLPTDQVVEALEGCSSLAELAEQQGVSRGDLVAALVAGAPSSPGSPSTRRCDPRVVSPGR